MADLMIKVMIEMVENEKEKSSMSKLSASR